jgi:hypothetical protein
MENKDSESFREPSHMAKLQAPVTYCPPGKAQNSVVAQYIRPTSRRGKSE